MTDFNFRFIAAIILNVDVVRQMFLFLVPFIIIRRCNHQFLFILVVLLALPLGLAFLKGRN